VLFNRGAFNGARFACNDVAWPLTTYPDRKTDPNREVFSESQTIEGALGPVACAVTAGARAQWPERGRFIGVIP